jgi:SAM-dependent methyltransferase
LAGTGSIQWSIELTDIEGEDQQRLYKDLSWIWPIVTPPDEYVRETEFFSSLIKEHSEIEVKSLLNLGCSGGNHDYTLKKYFNVTGVDNSEAMLALARNLNPEVVYHDGDMRNLRIEGLFDAVTIFNSINSLLSEGDLAAAFTTAYIYLKPGGILFTMAEITRENFKQNKMFSSTHVNGDTDVTFIENYYDSNPTDSIYEATFVFLVRQGGRLKIENDRHLLGIFRTNTWLDLLQKTGFSVNRKEYVSPDPEIEPFPLFICSKPAE